MMLSRSKMVRLLWPVRSMATRLGTLARIRLRAAASAIVEGRPSGAPGQLVLADLIRGQRGGPRVAAEERGEMGDPAEGGAPGPELPDLVMEVGVAEISQGRPLGAERARDARETAGSLARSSPLRAARRPVRRPLA